MLIKLMAIVVAVWFFKQAKKVGENGVQWALIGLIGYAIVVTIFVFAVTKPILAGFHAAPSSPLFLFFDHLLPPVTGVIACYFVSKKLIKQASKTQE